MHHAMAISIYVDISKRNSAVRELDSVYFHVLHFAAFIEGDCHASYENLVEKLIMLLVGRLGKFGAIFRGKSLNFVLH
jgi:hypothetical protein